ncbi:MAG: DUF3299 domain-containing protein, partial [Cyanobacteria bacterium J06649_4]
TQASMLSLVQASKLWLSRFKRQLLCFVMAALTVVLLAVPATSQNVAQRQHQSTAQATTQSPDPNQSLSPSPIAITWDDLQSSSTQLRNPYEHLSETQTFRLSTLYKLKAWAEENPPAPDSIEAEEIRQLEQSFADEGLDADALLVHAEDARAYWQSKSQATNADFEGRSVQLSGYILPLGDDADSRQSERVSEFLLVPFVGACIHVPPPAPNQMVYVKPTEAIANPGLFSLVQLTGELRSQNSTHEIFRVDGSRTVTVSYAMSLEAIAQDPNATPRPMAAQLSGPWWHTIPARVSSVLTVSLGELSRQTSLRTMVLAMMFSFSYGVLHTLGPGHGKAVIVSYFVGNGGSLRRGVLMGVETEAMTCFSSEDSGRLALPLRSIFFQVSRS